ncbi:lactate utilization protein B [Sinomonas albida]|uniref:lactate utilization protein B n=1 Tax=Sinomonas albida TaxID=369942 RepID=UPI003019463B
MSSVSLGIPAVPTRGFGNISAVEPFPQAAHRELGNAQLRANLGHATHTIRDKRLRVVSELPDWEALRDAGSAIKTEAMSRLPELLTQFEEQFTARGGTVHWARDAAEANRIVEGLIRETGSDEVVKVKSMATQEIGLNEYLEERGIAAFETDLAELIVQLGHDKPSHILVPAIHKNRTEIRDIFLREMPDVDPALTDEPRRLAMAARAHLRRKFLSAKVAISGANFGIAETGTLGVVESEGNGRMCLTLPETLITVMGIEKVLPRAQDLEVFMQLLPRSSTGERMNPYTSLWTGVTPGDGPQNVHVVLLDNGRTRALADRHGRSALHCIRCSACMNVCPVYERTGGHAYGSTYPGPIGAILSPLLTGVEAEENSSLPYASSLCGACFDACPVKINIPEILVHLRGEDVDAKHGRAAGPAGADRAGAKSSGRRRGLPTQMDVALGAASWALSSGDRLGLLEKGLPVARALAGRYGKISRLPGLGAGWTQSRDIPAPPSESFRSWWKKRQKDAPPAEGDGSTRGPATGGAPRDGATEGEAQ